MKQDSTSDWKRWERQVHEERLLGNHFITVQYSKQSAKKQKTIKNLEEILLAGIKNNWTYLKKTPPPPIEIAWIIYSQLGWKSNDPNLEEEELWEDLPEIDPIEIILLCQEIEEQAQSSGTSEIESLISTETLFGLKRILNELALKGFDIREERFSLNWMRKKKRHRAGRIQEITAREKNALEKNKDNSQKCGLLIKKTIDKKKIKKMPLTKGGKKSAVTLLASFFRLA
jgi:hypothetical protein